MPDFWEFPTVSMGLGPDQRDLPGAAQQVPARPGHQGHLRPARLGVPRRRRDGRGREPRRAAARGRRGARQPDLRHQLQPAAARRAGPRQRQDHPGARGLLPRRRLERHQGHLGPRVGPAAGRGPRRRAGQPHERDAGRRLPDLPGRERRLHPRALLRPRPAHPRRWSRTCPTTTSGSSSAAGTTTARSTPPTRPPLEHTGQPTVILAKTIKGYGAGAALRRPQRDPPDEEAHARGPEAPPRRAADPDHGRAARGRPVPAAVLPPGRRSDETIQYLRERRRRLGRPAPAAARRTASALKLPEARRLRRRRGAGSGKQAGGHDDGVRPAAQGPDAGQGVRAARRADHPRRGPHVRHGLVLPDREDLQPARAALHLGGPRADARLQGVRDRADPPRRHQRGGLGRRVHRGRHVVRHARRAAWSRSTSSTRCSASSAPATPSGRRPTRWPAASSSARPPAGRRSPARACSTPTGTPPCSPRPTPRWSPTTRRTAYEIGHIVRDGLRRMYGESPEDVFYYLTVYNEPIVQPAEPEGVDVEGILRGMYLLPPGRRPGRRPAPRPAARLRRRACRGRWRRSSCCATTGASRPTSGRSRAGPSCAATGCAATSTPSCSPGEEPRVPYVTQRLARRPGPVVAVSDYMRAGPGPDPAVGPAATSPRSAPTASGFSDTRAAARRYFAVDGPSIATRLLLELAAARRGRRRPRRPRPSSSTGCTT